ncbi:MAG: hypothetical protein WKF40_04420 [Thermoleophilaceae bacterium]
MTETCSQVAIAEPWERAARPGPGVELRIGPEDEIHVRGPMISAAAAARAAGCTRATVAGSTRRAAWRSTAASRT